MPITRSPIPQADYAGIWHHAQEARQKLEKLPKEMADIEEATTDSDRTIREQLESTPISVEGAISLMPKSYPKKKQAPIWLDVGADTLFKKSLL